MTAPAVTEWETKIRKAKADLETANSIPELREAWKTNLGLGHKVLGCLFTGWDVEKMVEQRA